MHIPVCSFCQEKESGIEIQGFIMTDAGFNFNTIDPAWFDVMRPTKLPARPGEFRPDGKVFYGVRQTRFGIWSTYVTRLGEMKTQFDFDLFGFGKNAGQTTFHLINGYGQLGKLLVGQTASTFMDQDVPPVTLDYWGPMSRVFNFNIQIRYMPVWRDDRRLAFSIERPGATADGGDDATSIQLSQVKPVYRAPNITAQYRYGRSWGHLQLAVLGKLMQWRDRAGSATQDLSGTAWGWGWTFSAVIKASERIKFKAQTVQGHGVESHIADAPADVVPQSNAGNPLKPIKGIAQPVWGFFSFAEINWSNALASSIGYSQETVRNGNLQAPDAFRKGQYALVNLRYMPSSKVMMGIEYQYGRRLNVEPGYEALCNKLQLSFKYNFSAKLSE